MRFWLFCLELVNFVVFRYGCIVERVGCIYVVDDIGGIVIVDFDLVVLFDFCILSC